VDIATEQNGIVHNIILPCKGEHYRIHRLGGFRLKRLVGYLFNWSEFMEYVFEGLNFVLIRLCKLIGWLRAGIRAGIRSRIRYRIYFNVCKYSMRAAFL
jgi:hypothetical protein